MIEIKFRIFENEIMLYPLSRKEFKNVIFWSGFPKPEKSRLRSASSVFMQFTGFKDKHDKEIYEGDVFRSETEKDYGDERIYSVVTWIKERGAFYLIPVDHYQIYMDNDNLENDPVFEWLFEEANLYDFNIDIGLDLCGNIYENPELVSYSNSN